MTSKGGTIDQIKAAGADSWCTDLDSATWPGTGTGVPFSASHIMFKGDPIADLLEDRHLRKKQELPMNT